MKEKKESNKVTNVEQKHIRDESEKKEITQNVRVKGCLSFLLAFVKQHFSFTRGV